MRGPTPAQGLKMDSECPEFRNLLNPSDMWCPPKNKHQTWIVQLLVESPISAVVSVSQSVLPFRLRRLKTTDFDPNFTAESSWRRIGSIPERSDHPPSILLHALVPRSASNLKNHGFVEENTLPKVHFQVPCGPLPGCQDPKIRVFPPGLEVFERFWLMSTHLPRVGSILTHLFPRPFRSRALGHPFIHLCTRRLHHLFTRPWTFGSSPSSRPGPKPPTSGRDIRQAAASFQ